MQKFKRRKCRLCEKLALQNKSLCYQHFLEANRKKREDKLAKQAVSKQKKKSRYEKSENYRKILFKKAWDLQSRAMRQAAQDDDGYVYCYTCGKYMRWQDAHIGHYFHGRLDFDKRNLRIQGACCNTYKHGNLAVYGARLAEEGIDLKQLRFDAEIKGNNYSIAELKSVIEKYK